ncbi:MAG: winged helix-turn-helix transcriptional regulator [Halobacteriales archaeon]
MSQSKGESGKPQAVIHKRILDVAESDPDASLEGIADDVSGATVDLVERVLREYGDPNVDDDEGPEDATPADTSTERDNETATEQSSESDARSASGSNAESSDADTPDSSDGEGTVDDTDAGSPPDPELSGKQVDALRLIEENPGATQRELAAELDVSAATVSRWLNDIPGFDWDRRESFASRTLDGGGVESQLPEETDGSESPARENGSRPVDENAREGSVEGLRQRIDALGERIESLDGRVAEACADDGSPGVEPDLLHKVIHACIDSDRITEEEELRVLEELIGDAKEG